MIRQNDRPLIVVANEFFDALPIKQFIRIKGHGKNNALDHNLNWTTISADIDTPDAPENSICKTCPATHEIMQMLQAKTQTQKGGALIIDYGYDQSAGDSQAVHKRKALCDHRQYWQHQFNLPPLNFHATMKAKIMP